MARDGLYWVTCGQALAASLSSRRKSSPSFQNVQHTSISFAMISTYFNYFNWFRLVSISFNSYLWIQRMATGNEARRAVRASTRDTIQLGDVVLLPVIDNLPCCDLQIHPGPSSQQTTETTTSDQFWSSIYPIKRVKVSSSSYWIWILNVFAPNPEYLSSRFLRHSSNSLTS